MDSENTNCDDIKHNRLKKCGFCGKELQPIGLDYLYANISEDSIEYERCNCSKSKEYWKEIDNKVYEQQKRIRIRDIINTIYKVKCFINIIFFGLQNIYNLHICS